MNTVAVGGIICEMDSTACDLFNRLIAERDAARQQVIELSTQLAATINERDAARAEAAQLREQVAALRSTCQDIESNLEMPLKRTARDIESACAMLRGVLDATKE